MIDTLCILGRQPALGLAELESLFGSDNIRPVGSYSAIIKIDPTLIDFTRLGGTIKFCKILTVLDTTDWAKIQGYLEKAIPEHIANLQTGKMKLGLSVYGLDVSVQKINSTNLSLKKVIKITGRSIRVIPNVDKSLNSAQVLHNQLTGALGWELVFVRDGKKTILAQNIAEQDIEAYAARDQVRPKRDTKVGMLPPKLAQIIINVAIGQVEPVDPSCGPIKDYDKTILDPFCGTGVVLQEALLMGYGAYGTDLEQKMVEYSQTNLEWLRLDNKRWELEVGDATNYRWEKTFDTVATETYLGRPFSAVPSPDVLAEVISTCNLIHKKFLKNLATQTKSGLRLCLAVPAWKTKNGFKHLPVLDQLTDMGYTRLSFVHARNEELIYHRENQIVARELIILIRK